MSWNAPNLPADKHRFFDRHGGVSNGRYESLNVNRKSADAPENIRQNINIAAGAFGMTAADAAFPCQGVTGHAEYTDAPSLHRIEADGLVTDRPGILLGITTADCAPVLFADFKNGVIGAAHAGWRGAVRGIMENTLALMLQHGAELKHIAAAVGPCLQKILLRPGPTCSASFSRRILKTKVFSRRPAPNVIFLTWNSTCSSVCANSALKTLPPPVSTPSPTRTISATAANAASAA